MQCHACSQSVLCHYITYNYFVITYMYVNLCCFYCIHYCTCMSLIIYTGIHVYVAGLLESTFIEQYIINGKQYVIMA